MKHHPDDRFAHIDLKHFFMSGSCGVLVDAIRIFSPKCSNSTVICVVAFFLLSSPIVTSKLMPSRIWRMTNGTCMGLEHSGASADLVHLALVELPFCFET